MILDSVFSPKTIKLNLESTEKDELFEELLEVLVSVYPSVDRTEALSAMQERESKMSTGIMHGIAIPHGATSSVEHIIGAIGISKHGIDYESLDGSPVHLVFLVLYNSSETEGHLAVLKDLATVLQDPSFMKNVIEMQSAQDVYDLLLRYKGNL